MNKLYIFVMLVIVIVGGVFAFIIYSGNKVFQEEQLKQQQEIEKVKQQQESIDRQLRIERQQKADKLQQEQAALMQKDTDRDGLTYEEELRLGTSDDNRDSDGDGIDDNEDKHPAGGGKIYTKTVHWTHRGLGYTTQFGIAEDKYQHYKDQERDYCCAGWDEFATPDDLTIETIAKDIIDVSISTGETCKACIAIDFVQSMIYEYDIEYIGRKEYPKYAIETIMDEKGDCEDTSFLMASILEAIGIDTILLVYDDHLAVGVWCNGCTGTYYEYKGRNYFFLETTGYADNWQIGEIWGGYDKESPEIIDV